MHRFIFAASLEHKTISCPESKHGHKMKMTLIGCCRRCKLKAISVVVAGETCRRWESEVNLKTPISSQREDFSSRQSKRKVIQIYRLK